MSDRGGPSQLYATPSSPQLNITPYVCVTIPKTGPFLEQKMLRRPFLRPVRDTTAPQAFGNQSRNTSPVHHGRLQMHNSSAEHVHDESDDDDELHDEPVDDDDDEQRPPNMSFLFCVWGNWPIDAIRSGWCRDVSREKPPPISLDKRETDAQKCAKSLCNQEWRCQRGLVRNKTAIQAPTNRRFRDASSSRDLILRRGPMGGMGPQIHSMLERMVALYMSRNMLAGRATVGLRNAQGAQALEECWDGAPCECF